jgi:predicted DNA-binding WGR domain protein
MILVERKVLSYQDEKSDKVYIVELYDVTPASATLKLNTIITSWGRRLSPRLSSQIKCDSVIPIKAIVQYRKIVDSKLKTGYVRLTESDLQSFVIPGYNTSVRREGYINPIVQTRAASAEITPDLAYVDTTYRSIK